MSEINNEADNYIKKLRKFKIFSIMIFIILLIIFFGIYHFFIKNQDIETIKNSVVMVKAYYNDELLSTGSGFCTFKENFIITNYHVIEGANKITILIPNNDKEVEINKIEAISENNDLAIISGNFKLNKIKIGNDKDLKLGDSITAIGYPVSLSSTVSTGIISNNDEDYDFRITAPISPGNSGGALLDKNNKIVGVVYATSSDTEANDINYAIKFSYVMELYNGLNKNDLTVINDTNYMNYISNINKFNENILKESNKYYTFDNFTTFSNISNMKRKYELSLERDDSAYFNIYNSLSDVAKKDTVDITENFYNKYTNIYLDNIENWNTSDIFMNTKLIEIYKYVILSEKLVNMDNKEEEMNFVNSIELDNGLKYLLLKFWGDYNYDDFDIGQKREIYNFLYSKIGDEEKVKEIIVVTK